MQQQTFAEVPFEQYRKPPPGTISRRDESRGTVGGLSRGN